MHERLFWGWPLQGRRARQAFPPALSPASKACRPFAPHTSRTHILLPPTVAVWPSGTTSCAVAEGDAAQIALRRQRNTGGNCNLYTLRHSHADFCVRHHIDVVYSSVVQRLIHLQNIQPRRSFPSWWSRFRALFRSVHDKPIGAFGLHKLKSYLLQPLRSHRR